MPGFAHSKKATLTVTNAIMNTDLMAIQSGTEVYRGSTNLQKYDIMTPDAAGKYRTKLTAIGTPGTEIGHVYIVDESGNQLKHYMQNTAGGVGYFTYNPTTRTLEFTDGDGPLPDETLVCSYTFKSADNAQKIHITADGIPPLVNVVGFGLVVDNCSGEKFMCQIEGRAQVDGNWNMDLSADGEPIVQNLSMEFIRGCFGKDLYTYSVYTEDEDEYIPAFISLTVPTGDLLGKPASELATDLSISMSGKASGTLNKVTNYTGFSSNPSEQNGYYLPFKVDVPADRGEAIATMQVNDKKAVPLDLNDGIGIIFMGKDEATARGKTITLEIDWDGELAKYPHETIVLDTTNVVYAK